MTIIGVPGLSDEESMSEFVTQTRTSSLTHLNDVSEIWDRFGVSRQRTYVYINDDGSWRTAGYGSLEADVQALIDS